MQTWKHAKKMVMILVVSCIFSSTSSGAEGGTFQEVLTEYLEMGPSVRLNINAHGKSAEQIDKRLIDIYHKNGFQPFWIENGKPSRRAQDIIGVLKDAYLHGLDPASYFIKNIDLYWNSRDKGGLSQLDILLTLGMMRYVADQREGRIEPRQIDEELFATASDVEIDWDRLRETAFKAPDVKAFLDEQAPSFYQYDELKKRLAEYRMIAQVGGWPSLPDGQVLKPGMEDNRLKILRKRLAVTGEIGAEYLESTTFDPQLVEAVKKFQKRHNLSADGVVGKQTLAALNVPVSYRIQQIIVNMERYRWLKRMPDEKLVAVNIAGFEAVAGRPGAFDISMPVIVGKTYHKTPVFSDTIKYIVFNPYWTLTPSIAGNETLPKLKKDPHYLKKQNMRIFNGWGPDAVELDATTIDWSSVSKKNMNRYRIRQDPGPTNALGTLKLVFPNKFNVYMHDTPAHGLFKQDKRAFSHGCIRMSRPAEMAAWVLGGEAKGWSVERVNEIVASKKRTVVNLEKPLPVYILYRTAYFNPEDKALHFYEDLYGRDALLAKALFNSES